MTLVYRSYQYFRPRKLAVRALTYYSVSINERLLSESIRSHMLAYYLSVNVLLLDILS
jgi:hypothetical protein